MALSSESADILRRLEQLNVPSKVPSKTRAVKARNAKKVKDAAAKPRSGEYGRRRMSLYQAKALGSGRGVLPAQGIQYTMSPQQTVLDGVPSYWVSCGKATISGPSTSRLVHILFPEWVD